MNIGAWCLQSKLCLVFSLTLSVLASELPHGQRRKLATQSTNTMSTSFCNQVGNNCVACKAAANGIPRLSWHLAPRTVTLDILVLTFTDVTPPSNADLQAHYSTKPQEYLTKVSDGCFTFTVNVIGPISLGVTEKDGDACRLTGHEQLLSYNLATIAGWSHFTTQATMVMPVIKDCGMPGSQGPQKLKVNGATVSFLGIAWGHDTKWDTHEATNLYGKKTGFLGSQRSYTHELLHLAGVPHANLYACNNQDPTPFQCFSLEYGDSYDIMGNAKLDNALSARARYNLGWLGSDDVLLVNANGEFSIAATDSVALGTTRSKPIAAVLVPAKGEPLWLEYRPTSIYGSSLTATELEWNTKGIFVHRANILIDATREKCADNIPPGKGSNQDNWNGENPTSTGWAASIVKATLNKDYVFVDHDLNFALKTTSVTDTQATVMLLKGPTPSCVRRYPEIATGSIGEWRFIPGSDDGGTGQFRGNLMAAAGSYTKGSAHRATRVVNHDSPACADARIEVEVPDDSNNMPGGWMPMNLYSNVFITQKPGAGCCSASPSEGHAFGFGIPTTASAGDYDFCVIAKNKESGLQSAKAFKLKMAGGGDPNMQAFTYNRPAYYENGKDCISYIGCDSSVSSCVATSTPGTYATCKEHPTCKQWDNTLFSQESAWCSTKDPPAEPPTPSPSPGVTPVSPTTASTNSKAKEEPLISEEDKEKLMAAGAASVCLLGVGIGLWCYCRSPKKMSALLGRYGNPPPPQQWQEQPPPQQWQPHQSQPQPQQLGAKGQHPQPQGKGKGKGKWAALQDTDWQYGQKYHTGNQRE